MIKVLINSFFIWIGNAIPNALIFHKYRPFFYRLAGLKIGKNVNIVGPISLPIDNKGIIEIGDNSRFNAETRFGS